jgi:DNA-binding transcriptional regulator of glucitol operon
VWHLLTLGAMATCGWLAVWQWERAGSAMGSALNVGYGLQWPVFAVFFGVMWWRMLRMEAEKLQEDADSAHAPDPVRGRPAESLTAEGHTAEGEAAIPEPRTAEPRSAATSGASSPFGPRPHPAPAPPDDDEDPELADYNRMLAQLAARHTED